MTIWNIKAKNIQDVIGGDKIVGGQLEKDQTQKINILFVGASPNDQPRIRDDNEYKLILSKLDEERFSVTPILAATYADIVLAVSSKPYDIWHFASHGANKYLVIETSTHSTVLISHQHIVSMLSYPSVGPQLLILNGCNTRELGQYIGMSIHSPPMMIVTKSEITDHQANLLVQGLYAIMKQSGQLPSKKEISFLLTDPALSELYDIL